MGSGGIRSKRKGEQGEIAAHYALNTLGLRFIESIHQAWKLIRWTPQYGRNIGHFVPLKKLSGDFRAVGPNGESVLIEVKFRDDRLLWSNLAKHQHAALSEHARVGGISLVVWVASRDIFILRYPIDGFAPHMGLDERRARILNIKELK